MMTDRFVEKSSWVLILPLVAVLVLSGCNSNDKEESQESAAVEDVFTPLPEGTVNFAEHIAPIIYQNCSECHRPGQAAPFELLSYDDVKKRAKQIVEVTESRYMPPWLPDQPRGTFLNEKILSKQAIGTLAQWLEEGTPMGSESKLPPVPDFPNEWKLGKPDLIVKLQEKYQIPAEGEDIYRNFVIPLEEMPELKFVRSVDFRPSNPRVVHHMVLLADNTYSSRIIDQESEEPGFPGIMSLTKASMPYGHFHGWTPGKEPTYGTEGIAWPLITPTDLVLQVHMQTTGKPEELDVEIGFYLTSEEPKYHPYPLVFRNKVIEIPAGSEDVRVKGNFRLPVDVQVLSIYPHAHFLGKEMKATAYLPDNTQMQLLSIPKWDFDWQDEYSYPGEKVIFLPAGTMLEFDYSYDNSADNPNNPNNQPVDVFYGQNSTDEMAELLLMVLTKNQEDYDMLTQYTVYNALAGEVQAIQWKLGKTPDDLELRNQLAVHLVEMGDGGAALEELLTTLKKPEQVLNENPEQYAFAVSTAAQLQLDSNKLDEAEQLFSKASELYQSRTNSVVQSQVEFYRAEIAYLKENRERAEELYRKAIALNDAFHEAYNALAWMYAESASGPEDPKLDQAVDATTQAIDITQGQYGPYLISLARIQEKKKDIPAAKEAYSRALTLAQELQNEEQVSRIKELIANLSLIE